MANPSPLCTVKDGSGSPQATPPYATITPGNTVTIALASTAGVDTWSISCVYADETTDPSSIVLTVNSTSKTATFTAPAAGKALIFRSVVNGGIDINGVTQDSYTTTFKAATLINGLAVSASNETYEHDAVYGWTAVLNDVARAVSTNAQTADTYQALRDHVGGFQNIVFVRGKTSADGNGAGYFRWDSTSTATDNNGTILTPTAGGTGRWIRLVDHGLGWVNVASFGALGDGSTPAGAAISAAITYVNGVSGGGTVFVPKGAYRVTGHSSGSDRITLKSNVRLVFEAGCTITTGTVNAQSIVFFFDTQASGTDLSNVSIEGNGLQITLDRSDPNNPSYGVYFYHRVSTDTMSKILIRGVHTYGGYVGLFVTGENSCSPHDILVEDCRFDYGWLTSASIDRGNDIRITRCKFTGSSGNTSLASGFDIEPQNNGTVRDVYFDSCTFSGNIGMGLYLQQGTTSAPIGTDRVFCTNCLFENNGDGTHNSHGFAASTVFNTRLVGCVSRGNYGSGFYGGTVYDGCRAYDNDDYGFQIPSGNVNINNCLASSNRLGGALFSSYTNDYQSSVISNCDFSHNTATSSKGIVLSRAQNYSIQNCRVTNNNTDGIEITLSQNNTVSNCLVAGNSWAGDASADNIIIQSAAHYNNLVGNQVRQSLNFHRGLITAGSGAASSVILNTTAGADYSCVGMSIYVVGGTGSGTGPYLITAYDQATRQATILGTFGTTPDDTSVVQVCGYGFYRGTIVAGSGAASSVRIGPSIGNARTCVGMKIFIVSGTGSGTTAYTITAFDQATGQVTISGTFSVTPDNTSVVQISIQTRPRYGLRIAASATKNQCIGNDVYYGGTTGGFSDGGTSTDSTGNRST